MSIYSLLFFSIVLCQHVNLTIVPENESGDEKQHIPDKNFESIHSEAVFNWQEGTVPYYIDAQSYDHIITRRIHMVMHIIERSSCVKFEDITEDLEPEPPGNWLNITNPDGVRECVHNVKIGGAGEAVLTIGYDCMTRRDIIHALMHGLGFNDEVTNPQRDKYIRVLWQNIQPQYRPLFQIRPLDGPLKTPVEYDISSIMHFHDRAYTINGAPTIASTVSGLIIRPADKLSQLDIMKLRLAFGHECKKRKLGDLFDTCIIALQENIVSSCSREHDDSQSVDDEKKSQSQKSNSESLNKE